MSSKKATLTGQLGDVHIRLLRIFRTVVECGGFSAAEVELNISRSAISIAIADLEGHLSMRLCHRGRSGFSLTDEGQQIYDAVLQLLSSLESFKTQVNAINTELKGELNIGITDNLVTLHHMRITQTLAKLKDLGPDVVINIRMIPPNDIERGVLDGRLHTGVIPELRPLAGLDYYPLYQEDSRLYCSDLHPLFTADQATLKPQQLAQFDAVIPAYAQTAETKRQQKDLKASATATDREGIAFLILSGRYLGFLPTHCAERWVEQGKMRAVLPHEKHYVTSYSAITRKGARPHLIRETYMAQLKQQDGVAEQ
ncbi:MAG: LysR family transcriptional regulator [Motiliproteus sp.]